VNPPPAPRIIKTDGPHTAEALNVLAKDLKGAGIKAAVDKASKIIELSVNPLGGAPLGPSDGLLYGLTT
jgi:hypothetical protein